MKKIAEKFIEITKNQDLYPRVSDLTIFTSRISGSLYKKIYKDKTPTPYVVAMKEGKNSYAFLPETKFKETASEFFCKYWQDNKNFNNHIKKIHLCMTEIDDIYNKYTEKDCNYTSIDSLLKIAKKSVDKIKWLNTLFWFTVYFEKDFCLDLLSKNNINISNNHFEEIWQKGSAPSFLSFDKIRQLEVLSLLRKKTKLSIIAKKCLYHFANYGGVDNYETVIKKIKNSYKNYSLNKINNTLSKLEKEEVEVSAGYTKWLKKLNHEEKRLAEYLQNIMSVRDKRKNSISKILAILYDITERLFDSAGIDKELIKYYTCDELLLGEKYLKNNLDNLKKRKKGVVVMFLVDGKKNIKVEYGTYDKTINKLEKFYFSKQVKINVKKELKGQIAYSGKVNGLVRVVNDYKNNKIFNEGEILVTSMTRPEFVPLMKRACAIITDEGGITCHAAIISRELQKPCIIGTKIATEVLHDGDLVEVDANKGAVKILKKG